MKEKMIEPIRVVEFYEDTGLPKMFSSGGLLFKWYSWVVCEVENFPGNARHHVIMTKFHCNRPFNSTGLCEEMMVTRWNPTYDDEHKDNVYLEYLHYWKPISVALLDPTSSSLER